MEVTGGLPIGSSGDLCDAERNLSIVHRANLTGKRHHPIEMGVAWATVFRYSQRHSKLREITLETMAYKTLAVSRTQVDTSGYDTIVEGYGRPARSTEDPVSNHQF